MAESAITARPLVNGRVRAVSEIAATLGCAAALVSNPASIRWAGGQDAVQPGAYATDLGVRLEHLAVVEADGARPLTAHALDL